MRILLAMALLIPLFGTAGGAESDCQSGERYLALAHEKAAASEFDAAVDLTQRAADACPSYDAFESLGELRAHSLQRSEHARAVDAFLSAHELAATDQARARSLYQYSRLLYLDGDPQNAYPLIQDARTLDPDNADIAALAAKIGQRINNPTKEQIVRGLWNSLYKPLRIASAKTRHGATEVAATTDANATTETARNDGPSVNIPINFQVGTTIVDAQTRANIAVLAGALADPSNSQQHFTFVGHADVRGIEANNLVLSKRRAEALSQAVVDLEPSLQGRIEVSGRGSSEPIDAGHDESAYRANRRLQVLLK